MQTPNRNALVIPPGSWPIAKINDEMIIAGTIPVRIFNLLNSTPLNANSSTMGAKIIAVIESRIQTLESILAVSISHIGTQLGSPNPIKMSNAEIRSTNRPANNMLRRKTYNISFLTSSLNRLSKFLSRPLVPRNAQMKSNNTISINRIMNSSPSSKTGNMAIMTPAMINVNIIPIINSRILIVLNRTLKSMTLLSIICSFKECF